MKKCTRCGKNPRHTGHSWCKACLSELGKRERQERLAKGLCIRCNKPHDRHTQLCTKCTKLQKAKDDSDKKRLRREGVCISCRKLPAVDGLLICRSCSDKKKRVSKTLRSERLSRGLCERCGKKPPVDGGQNCEECVVERAARMQLGSSKLSSLLWDKFAEQKGICPYTGMKLRIGVDASVDHVIPKSRGGTNDMENIQWVHVWINWMKNDTPKGEFVSKLKKFMEASYPTVLELT